MLIINDLAQFSCMIVSVAKKLDLLTNIDTALGESEGSQTFLVLLVDLLGQCFISLFSGSCLPLFQAMAVIVNLRNGFLNRECILRCHGIELTDTALTVHFFR